MITNILIGIIVLHLIVGFGFMVWKLNGKPITSEEEITKEDEIK
jgi:hypothetical protein